VQAASSSILVEYDDNAGDEPLLKALASRVVRRVRSSSSSDCMRRTPRLATTLVARWAIISATRPRGSCSVSSRVSSWSRAWLVGDHITFRQQLVTGTDPAMTR